jgi:hypothetical protein
MTRDQECDGGSSSLGSAWPAVARAQQPDKVRRIDVIMGFSVQNSEAKRRVAAFERKLAELGWKDGLDLEIEYRWPGNPPDRLRADIAEIVRSSPDAILVTNEPTLSFTSVATSTIPIVFANVTYAFLARHYDNVTGVIAIEPQVAEKWASVLKDLAPNAGDGLCRRAPAVTGCRTARRSMEQRSRWRWIGVVRFSRPVVLKFGDEEIQFLFRQVAQIALRQIGSAALKLGVFDEKRQKPHHFRSRLRHAQLPGGRPAAIMPVTAFRMNEPAVRWARTQTRDAVSHAVNPISISASASYWREVLQVRLSTLRQQIGTPL